MLSRQSFSKKLPLKANTQRAQRALALQLLYAIDRSNYELGAHEAINLFLENYNLEIGSDDFAVQMVYGVVAKNAIMEKIISEFSSNWKTERIGCVTKIIIKMALWEILESRNPIKVIIDQAVELSKSFCENDSYKFINGLLDKYSKSLESGNSEATVLDEQEPQEKEQESLDLN